MGLDCTCNRWSIPLRYSHSFSTSFFKSCSYSGIQNKNATRSREGPFKHQSKSLIPTAIEYPQRVRACSSAGLQASDSDLAQTSDGRRLQGDLLEMIDNPNITSGVVQNLAHCNSRASQAFKSTHFKLIMENLGVLERHFTDSEATRLEREILLQLGKLGALGLFKACLSRSLENSLMLNYPEQPNVEDVREAMEKDADEHSGKPVVQSRRRGVRKSMIERADKARQGKVPTSLQQMQKLCFPWDGAQNSKTKRKLMRSREGDLAKGVKMLKKLEMIRKDIEEDAKQVASLSEWAEASGMDEKTLQQHLHFSWYCRDELIRSTRSLVLFLSRSYRGMGIGLEDLIQAGYLGVLQGAERFDDTRGLKFSTYVRYWIRRSMSRMVARDARGIRLPYSLIQAMNKIQKARKSLELTNRQYPDDGEIAKSTGLSLDKVRAANRCLRVVGESLSKKLMEVTGDARIKTAEQVVMGEDMRNEISRLLKGLEARERQVLIIGFRLEGFEEIGKVVGVSKGWARTLEKRALSKLQADAACSTLRHYLNLHS